MTTGCCKISVPKGFNSLALFLEYKPSSSARRHSLKKASHPQAMVVTESWDHEKVNDFVIKVEMLEEEKVGGGWGQHYLQFHRVRNMYILGKGSVLVYHSKGVARLG